MVVVVIYFVLLIVKIICVIYRVECVLIVNLVGLELVVIEVRWEYVFLVGLFYVKYYFNFI